MLTKSVLKRHVGTACLRVQRFVTEIGERHGIEMLVYNPLVTYGYKRAARRSAPVIARSIHEYWPHIRTCIDCGCGLGQYVEEITRCGIQCDGVEYSARYRKHCGRRGLNILPWDLSAPSFSTWPRKAFDLALSIEVAEHVPAMYAEAFVKYLSHASDLVLLTAAPPGQTGTGHVNEQPKSYWINKFVECGYGFSEEDALWFSRRWTEGGAMGYLGSNVMVFKRRSG